MSSNSKGISLAIGAFIVGAILLVFIALLFFSGGRLFADKERVIMYFDGSVQGLQIGAPVKLKGVVLGEIIDIQINFQNDNQTVVTAVTADLVMKRINSKGVNVDHHFLTQSVQNGLRAQLNYQSLLTGLLYVELDFYPETAIVLRNLQHDHMELPTIGTSFEEISKNLQDIDLKGLISNINKLVDNLGELVSNGDVQTVVENFNRLTISMEKTSTGLHNDFHGLSLSLAQTLGDINVVAKELSGLSPKLSKTLEQSLAALDKTLAQVEGASSNLGEALSEDAPLMYQLNTTLKDVSRAARAFGELSETLDQQPEALLRGKKLLPERDE